MQNVFVGWVTLSLLDMFSSTFRIKEISLKVLDFTDKFLRFATKEEFAKWGYEIVLNVELNYVENVYKNNWLVQTLFELPSLFSTTFSVNWLTMKLQ